MIHCQRLPMPLVFFRMFWLKKKLDTISFLNILEVCWHLIIVLYGKLSTDFYVDCCFKRNSMTIPRGFFLCRCTSLAGLIRETYVFKLNAIKCMLFTTQKNDDKRNVYQWRHDLVGGGGGRGRYEYYLGLLHTPYSDWIGRAKQRETTTKEFRFFNDCNLIENTHWICAKSKESK